MQPGVTVVLATVWLVVYASLVGTVSHHPSRLTLDQYSPLAPQHQQYGVYRRVEGQPDWKDQSPGENQPFDLSIGPRSSIPASAIGSQEQSYGSKYLESDSLHRRSRNSGGDNFSPLAEDKQSRNFPGREFTDGKADSRDTKGPESASRELPPPSELEDPFVADDTFQDQGPGSVEIYKLDLLREKFLLSPTPITRFPSKGKSKAPKKTNHVNWKSKTTEYKATSLKMPYKQSNSFDDFSTEIPPNSDPFSVGGVPELQVGCEGLEASDHGKEKRSINSQGKEKRSIDPQGEEKRSIDFQGKEKRSIDTRGKDKDQKEADPWLGATPVSLDMDYEASSEEGYEEMDELLKLKKLETTTKGIKQNRGDMEATLHSDFHDDKRRDEKLPVRGDLGKSSVNNGTTVLPTIFDHGNQKVEEKATDEALHFDKGKREIHDVEKPVDGLTSGANQRRKILWFDDSDDVASGRNQKRSKRGIWGFGEDEGVVTSDELQTENQRRRYDYERRRQENLKRRQEEERRRQEAERRRAEEAQRRSQVQNQTNSEVERIREEYERKLEQTQREEEERQRRLQQGSQRATSNRWQLEEEQRRRLQEEESRRNRWPDEERRRQELEASRRRYESRPQSSTYEEERKREQQREEEIRRREENRLREEERLRRLREEEARRSQTSRWEEEMKRRQQQESDRRSLMERRREWMLKQRQREEEERRRLEQNRNEPSNLSYPSRTGSNESRLYDPQTERRMREQQEREHQRKLNEYIHRNRPITVNNSSDQRWEEANRRRQEEERRRLEEQRRRLEEERRLQEYVRRNQPVRVPKLNEPYDKNLQEHRRLDEARQYNRSRYPGSGSGRRNHGPSAQTNIDPRNYLDEAARREAARRIEEDNRIRERQRQQQEELRREALRREEEVRRMKSRKYEEERKRQEAARLEEERIAKEQIEEARRSETARTRPLVNTRPSYEDRRRAEEQRRRQNTGLIPANLFLNESTRATELQRQRQEQERRRLEAERQEQERRRLEAERQEQERRRLESERQDQERRRLEAERQEQERRRLDAERQEQERRRLEAQRQEQERRRLEAERRRQEERRVMETRERGGRGRTMTEQQRRQEEARLNRLPVSARIIVRPAGSSSSPNVLSRAGIDAAPGYPGINPYRPGVVVANFPSPNTRRPPIESPPPCVWAVVHCCSSNMNRLVRCFESMGCPGINWDSNACIGSIIQAANDEVMKFYAEREENDQFL